MIWFAGIKKRNMYQMDAEEEEGEEAELVVSRSKVAKTEADSSNAVTVSQLMGNLSKVTTRHLFMVP